MGTLVKNGINYTGAEGGSTTPTNLNGLTDVEISSPIDGQGLVYDSSTAKWKNGQGGVDTAKVYLTDDAAETTLADDDKMPFYDTSASAKKNTTWGNIRSNLAMPVMGIFSKGDLYSTTEKVIGCWADGRPVYLKCVAFGSLPNNTTKQVAHGISNLKKLVKWEAVGEDSSSKYVIPWASADSLNEQVAGWIDATYIYIQSHNNLSSNTCDYVALYYTKTTDAANSYNYSSENDYSTTEHIIGTWIDGKTLYQRTFKGTTASSGDTTVGTIGSSSRVKSWNGAIQQATTIDVPISVCLGGSSTDYSYPYNDGGTIKLNCGSEMRSKPYWITVQYIK